MGDPRRAVYLFCTDLAVDWVAGGVYRQVIDLFHPEDTGLTIDDLPVREYHDPAGNIFTFVQTHKVVSHDYPHHLPLLQQHFAGYDQAGIITWHAGQNAPEAIFPVHTTGEVPAGCFGPAQPEYMRNLLLGLERNRLAARLEEYKVTTEATHWSGMVYHGGQPEMIPAYPVPLLDIEIGSSPVSWGDPRAAAVLARSLTAVFTGEGRQLKRLLCAGGVHFEPAFAAAVQTTWGDYAFGLSHILANQWLVAGEYEREDGQTRLEACVQSIQGGIDGIVFHDNLKGCYKDQLRALGQKLQVPVFKHQWLRQPEKIAWGRAG